MSFFDADTKQFALALKTQLQLERDERRCLKSYLEVVSQEKNLIGSPEFQAFSDKIKHLYVSYSKDKRSK